MTEQPLNNNETTNTGTTTATTEKKADVLKDWFHGWRKDLLEWFKGVLDIDEGSDIEGTIKSIKENKKMQGTNVWMLFASIIIASIGLQVNSGAVIIGAMLISPLMSPILGVGLGVGINDRDLLIGSLIHLMASFVVALATSVLFFKLSPFTNPYNISEEILARTSPQFLDVLVAFFGGIAGIVSGSRKDKSNALPGVAIATALMPPVCVAGFGLAIGNWTIFLSSFYLFFLNSVFIALATYIMVRYMRFPYKRWVNAANRRKNTIYVSIIVLVTCIPSIFFLLNAWRDIQVQTKIETFVAETFSSSDRGIMDYKVIDQDSVRILDMLLKVEQRLDSTEVDSLKRQFADYNIKNTIIEIDQVVLTQREIKELKNKEAQLIDDHTAAINEKNNRIQALRNELDSLRRDTFPVYQLSQELSAMYPELTSIGYIEEKYTDDSTKQIKELPGIILKWDKKTTSRSKSDYEQRIRAFMTSRYKLDTVDLIRK